MKKNYPFIILVVMLILSCGQESNNKENTKPESDSQNSSSPMEPSASTPNNSYRDEQIKQLIATARQTIDSIDVAYENIYLSSRHLKLSLDEKEKVNLALQMLSNAKELIILETQKAVIEQLREKTSSLKNVLAAINEKSDRLNNISETISKVALVIEKTTNALADALTFGIVKPKIQDANL